MSHQEEHDHDRGLIFDTETLRRFGGSRDQGSGRSRYEGPIDRRRALGLFAGAAGVAGAAALVGASPAAAAISTMPSETGGPYPADGTNGPNVLDDNGIVRSDIRRSFGSACGLATGVPLWIHLHIKHASTEEPYAGAAVYLWHADRLGRYSLYSSGVEDQNYLRGVQVATPTGYVTFRSVYPACYDGRWPHIHYEVYENLASATSASGRLLTSQIALRRGPSAKVYSTSAYPGSAERLKNSSITTDLVFADSWQLERAHMRGNTAHGWHVRMVVGI